MSRGEARPPSQQCTVTEHKDTVVLTCLTNDMGSPSGGSSRTNLLLTDRMKLSQGNSTLTINPVRREDAGGYQCEVFNPVSSGTSDPFRLDVQSEQTYTGYSVGTIIGSVIGVLVVVALGASLGYFLYLRRTRRASDPRGLQEHPSPAAAPGQGPTGTSAFPGPLPDPKTAGHIYEVSGRCCHVLAGDGDQDMEPKSLVSQLTRKIGLGLQTAHDVVGIFPSRMGQENPGSGGLPPQSLHVEGPLLGLHVELIQILGPVGRPRADDSQGHRVPNLDQFLSSLLASLLTFWSLPTTAQLTIESVPPNAAQGKDVLLRVHNLPGNLGSFNWYKGEIVDSNLQILSYVIDTQTTILGPAYSGRETIYPNGSLLFQKVTLKNTGYYTLQATDKGFQTKQVTGQLHVYPVLPKPSITSNNSNPEEHKDPVVLMCEPQIQDTTYLWLINSQSLPASARLQLSKDNRTLTLLPVTRNDTGRYECETRNPVSAARSDPFTLNVLYGPDAPTISPSNSHYLRGANLRLFCLSVSNPPAQYSWFINGRPQQPTQELFIPNITRHDSGFYTCLAQNSVTGLKGTTVKTITVYEPVGKPTLRASNAIVTEHKDAVVLTCLTNDTGISSRWLFKNQNLLLTDRMKLSRDNSTLTIDPVRREDAGGYQCEVFNPVSSGKSDPSGWMCNVTEQTYTGYSVGTIVGSVIGILVMVALGASLGYFLYLRRTRRASDPRGLQEHPSPAAAPGQGPTGTSAFPSPLPDPRTAGHIYEVSVGYEHSVLQVPAAPGPAPSPALAVLPAQERAVKSDNRGWEEGGITQPKHRGVLPGHPQSRRGFLVLPGPETPDPVDVACAREPALSIKLSEISQWEKDKYHMISLICGIQ
ncbi:hypothetical protein QTO34_010321 [Cnephaeus nilssonii]|uniref:Ig-like domain-containing protein n=1 Tax=Cnephaeus nilssonii TaxID=3371016 RepID=A0AA40LER8_CNENI|nr:hypothetical protein QTO34_010321 [Eptesicus nilssonii]